MKKIVCGVLALALIAGGLAAQEDEDDVPYLTEEDWAAIEVTLPGDLPETRLEPESPAPPPKAAEANELQRLHPGRSLYHLLVVDRSYCAANADISGIDGKMVRYKLKHGKNGYLIAIYTSPQSGPVFPTLPEDSLLLLDMVTTRKNTLREYINSTAFSRFVTIRSVLAQMREALSENF